MKNILILTTFILLTGCGFSPLYVQHSGGTWTSKDNYDKSITYEMSQIRITPISERFGQQIRNKLLDLISPKGAPTKAKYRLDVELDKKEVSQQAMRDDVTATSERVDYTVNYKLYQGNTILVSGDSFAFVSYDVLNNPYSTTMAQKKSEENAANIIANDIALRIGAYFHSSKSTAQ